MFIIVIAILAVVAIVATVAKIITKLGVVTPAILILALFVLVIVTLIL